MLVLITYDVSLSNAKGVKRLRRVAKICTNYGQRVQNSVFECMLNITQLTEIKHLLENIINKETDSIRIYRLGDNYKQKIEHIGKNNTYNPTDTIIIIGANIK